MTYLPFLLALVALVAGLWLWRADTPRPRSQRKSWAREHGFGYAKRDDFLVGEWQRGAASSGAAPTNIASGQRFGHDTYVMDLGAATVVAMGTGGGSVVVVGMRRQAEAPDEDLVEAARVGDFVVFATEAGPAQRLIDVRVNTALSELPATVDSVWFEGEWVLAQLSPDAGPSDWEATLAPLAMLADAARTLPPRHPKPLDLGSDLAWLGNPAAPVLAAGAAEPPPTPTPAPPPTPQRENPLVQRPDEPLEMPTRTTGTVKGPVELRAVGGDEVVAIAGAPDERGAGAGGADGGGGADGTNGAGSTSGAGADLTRVRRKLAPPSIFTDAAPAETPRTDTPRTDTPRTEQGAPNE